LLHALSEMAAAENPSEDYQLSNAALFAMGTLARDNPELQPRLVETLSPMLTADGKASFEDTSTALRTLENAHNEDPAVMEKALLILSKHEEPDVRASAIGFLSTTGKPNAVQAIEKARVNDQSDIVRHEATAALTRKE
jgi:HEAT repeat protein